jgi:hypothetical protein
MTSTTENSDLLQDFSGDFNSFFNGNSTSQEENEIDALLAAQNTSIDISTTFLNGNETPTKNNTFAISAQLLFENEIPNIVNKVTSPCSKLSTSSNPTLMRVEEAPHFRAPTGHRHKRARSNPDVISNINIQQMIAGMDNGAIDMNMNVDINATSSAPASLAGTTQMPLSTQPSFELQANFNNIPEPLSISVGAIHTNSQLNVTDGLKPKIEVKPPPQLNTSKVDDSFLGIDDFLDDLSWAELADGSSSTGTTTRLTSGLGATADATLDPRKFSMEPVAYRTQRIQEGVNELKMKRKRPSHARHHSNPVDLLHNLDQFRILSQEIQQQQHIRQQNPLMNYNTVFGFASSSMQPQMQQFNQFQVPTAVANGSMASLHKRRASLPMNVFDSPPRSAGPFPPRPAARGSRHSRSTGLSMDMSSMNLSFLLPGDQQQNNSACKKADDANRKMYKCGRCGQPKVGHVCSMPDLRNNWSQVDLEVTKGLKFMRLNVQILPVKNNWIPAHEDNTGNATASSIKKDEEEEKE